MIYYASLQAFLTSSDHPNEKVNISTHNDKLSKICNIIKTNVAEALTDIMLNDVLTRMWHEIKYIKKKKITQHVIKCIKKGTFTPIVSVAKILTEILDIYL